MGSLCHAGMIAAAILVTSGSAFGQSSSIREMILENPFSQLRIAVRILTPNRPSMKRDSGGVIAIDSCLYPQQWGATPDDDFLEHFQHIAEHYVHMWGLLSSSGYPNQVWEGLLTRLITVQIDEIVRRRNSGLDLRDLNGVRHPALPVEQQLANALNSYRAQSNRDLPKPDVWKQCGGDYVGFVKVGASPGGASIRLIREFYYKFCQATGIHPFSEGCDKWNLVTASSDVPGGIYYYVARWPSGHTECDRIEFSVGGPNDEDKTIVINQSGKVCGN